MQTLQVTSPAKDFFTSLKRYPNMRGEVEVNMRGLRAALGSVYRAAHGICERLVKLKVCTVLHCLVMGMTATCVVCLKGSPGQCLQCYRWGL